MKNTKTIASIAILTALYFVLSAMLKIPIAGHITLDLGYMVLTVSAVYLGAVPTMIVGMIGAFCESAMLSHTGISLGWILMNACVGFFCGKVMKSTFSAGKKKFLISSSVVILLSMFVGVVIKTLIDCVLRSIPIPAKIPSSLAAFITDSLVMFIGIPIAFALRKHVK